MKCSQTGSTAVVTALVLSAVIVAGCSDTSTGMAEPGDAQAAANQQGVASESTEQAVENEMNSVIDTTQNETEQNTADNVPAENPDFGLALGVIENAALVFIAEESSPTGLIVSSSAQFFALATPLNEEPVLSSFTMLDTCEVGSESSQINAEALNLPIDHVLEASGSEILQVTPIAAGDTVELTSDSGSYISLMQSNEVNDLSYSIQDGTDLSMAVPDSLSINVFGADFPQLESSWFTPLRLTTDLRAAVRMAGDSATLTWVAANSSETSQSRLQIYAGFLDELTGEFRSFQCEVADDGEFTLPEDVLSLYANGVNPNFVDVARYSRSVQLINDISVVHVFLQRL